MRILAVRGKNLASLAGHFEVDFAAPPLQHAGLIAITGPTGAGKTTLLDAMCLALFDRTPRFANRGGVVIASPGDDPSAGVRATDVRGILRHGATEGWAEVDFLGIDDRRWRARWELRRARGRADGRLQHQQMQLIDPVDGRVIAADRKGDTLAAIEARLGLDFDQFRRSVLLAQGEFAAFLEASGGERAELLERMTGTWLYRELGRGAFERAKQAERELDLVAREREQLRILPEPRRRELEAEAARTGTQRAGLEQERIAADAALRWYQRADELAQALTAARTSLAELDRGQAELAQTEALLARVERVAAVRERLLTRERRAGELEACERDLAFVTGELPLIVSQLAELAATLERHEQQLARARERRRRLMGEGGEVDRARQLDTKIATAGSDRPRVASKLELARSGVAASDAQLEQIQAGIAQAEARLAGARSWLERHQALAPLAEHWPHYRSLLQQQLRWLEARAAVAQRVAELGPRRERCEREQAEAKREHASARKQRNQARTRLQKVERDLDAHPALAQLRHRQAALDLCRDRHSVLRAVHERYERLAITQAALGVERAEQVLERDHRAAQRRRVEAALAQTEQGFAEAQRGLRQLEAVRDLVQHRADLRPGEACPLCGSHEHPAADEQGPVDAVVADQRARVQALMDSRDELQREQGEQLGREQIAATRVAAIARRTSELARDHAALQEAWRDGLAAGPLLPAAEHGLDGPAHDPVADEPAPAPDPQLSLLAVPRSEAGGELVLPERLDSPDLGTALWSIHEELELRSRALASQRAEVENLLDRQRDRQARREEAERVYEDRRARVEASERELDVVVRELDEAHARGRQLDADLDASWPELEDVGPAALAALHDDASPAELEHARAGAPADPVPDVELAKLEHGGRHELAVNFRARLAQAGQGLLAQLDAGAKAFSAQRQACEQAAEGQRALETRRAELSSQRQARAETCEALELELRELDELLTRLRSERATLLEGRPAAEVVRELEASVELASQDRETSKDARAKVERELQAQRTRAHTLTEQVAALRGRSDEAQVNVDAALAEAGVDPTTLEQLLAREELWADGWTARTRSGVEQARAELERRRAIVGERERVVAAHADEGPPPLDRERAQLQRNQLDTRDEQLRRQLFELEHQLRRDREDRSLAEQLAPRLRELEHTARVWGRLRDAIGSASGDKFQKFAQSLTLELLLTQANAQLRDLKPRYALGRVPNHDLELQLVDHDLGDEVRSIRGLSGGEKFLVSLALALALASLSADDCRIDSLFIDEGFGSLDAHSLDVAVSTLDALQAEGRQIGVISHVPGLAERIGVEIRVETIASGRSRVRVVAPRST
ncbi:Exonuclease SbcC [Enhygromyxa salina]|uniref:Exonuclease SbcC n=1 Tax=Enhygromyxa salina TaxID=215803 RepID=A0A0C2CUG2_9BACT|nr:AAA family ATPase [Enhygromyxa salina]KIG13225.1 Exonuclease SbcC [Enhygromyxa salina]